MTSSRPSSASPLWTSLTTDWFGASISPPVQFRFACDARTFTFHARRASPACCHPAAVAGRFQSALWKYDVAEFFLTDPLTGHYLEANLAPNGAYWLSLFAAPRQPVRELPDAPARASASVTPNGWSARLVLPLAWLRTSLHFGSTSRLNATFILDSPRQRFLTAHPLPGEVPDFHQCGSFPPLPPEATPPPP